MVKDYGYIWILMVRIFKFWVDDDDFIIREVLMEVDDFRFIVFIIVECEFLLLYEIFVRRKSRFL